jgi:hypothetical protein
VQAHLLFLQTQQVAEQIGKQSKHQTLLQQQEKDIFVTRQVLHLL